MAHFGGAVLQVPTPAQTSGDGGLDLKLVFPAGPLCSDARKVALLWSVPDTAITQETCSPQRR